MGTLKDFARCLSDVHLNGVLEIDSCVVKVKDNKARIMAIDPSGNVFIDTSCELEADDCELGINRLSNLQKYVNMVGDRETKISVTEKTVIFKPSFSCGG